MMFRAEGGTKPQATWASGLIRAALVVYWIGLFAATHVPTAPQVDVPGGDKTIHIVGYGILALLLGVVVPRPFPVVRVLVLLAAYAAFDELTQPLVGRKCDLNDWLADVGGSALGLATSAIFRKFIS